MYSSLSLYIYIYIYNRFGRLGPLDGPYPGADQSIESIQVLKLVGRRDGLAASTHTPDLLA